jgi:hypothetical protein
MKKTPFQVLWKKFNPNFLWLILFLFVIPSTYLAQITQLPECNSGVPFFNINLSSNPDSTYVTPVIDRQNQCCGGSGNENYVSFYVTLHPDVAMIEIGIAPGYADPGGSGFYNIISGGSASIPGICGTDIAGGTTTCITGVGPHKITYHKPGKNKVQYYLKQIPRPIFPENDTTRVGCSKPLNIYGLNNIVINSINSSTGNTTLGAYNSLLSCVNCSNPIFSPGLSTPTWIDYRICGSPQASSTCGTYASCDTVRVFTYSQLVVNVSPNPASFCQGGGGVLLTASATGGLPGYTYTWRNSSNAIVGTGSTYTATTQGTFTVEVSDQLVTSTCGPVYRSVPVTIGNPPIVNAGQNQTLCATSPTVFLEGTVQFATGGIWSGGTGTYNPSNTSLITSYTPSASEINAGQVTLTLNSTGAGGGCSNSSDQVTVFFSDTLYINPIATPINCYNGISTISTNATGGAAPLTYLWSTNATTASITAPAGTYSIYVLDTLGCSANTTISINEPSPLAISFITTNETNPGDCDGTATVTIIGGLSPYIIQWNDPSNQIGNTATGLCYGITTVTVTDALGCSITGSVVINNSTCSLFNVTANNTNLACYGDTDATATASVSGGSSNYTISWNDPSNQSVLTATGLSVGTYTVTVRDNISGCVDVATVFVSQPTAITNTMTHIDASSIGGNDGSATANPTGGAGGYSYLWNDPSIQITQTAINLTANVYEVLITDVNNCDLLDSVRINQPPCNNFIIAVNTTNITCNGADNGTASLFISQGTAPFTRTWYFEGSPFATNVNSVANLQPGNYTVEVTDASNCTTFRNFTITEPDPLTIGIIGTNISCFGANDGTIDLTISGGSFPYTFEWLIGNRIIATHEDIVNLGIGTYSITVTDANGCTISGSTGITQPQPLLATATRVDVSCFGGSNGSINAIPLGGVVPYVYSWTGPGTFSASTEDLTGLSVGLYELTFSDANNCELSTPLQVYINQPDAVQINSVEINCPTPGASSTVIEVNNITGGAGYPYQVSFNNGATYLASGVYNSSLSINTIHQLWARDINGCTSALVYEVVINPSVVIDSVSFNPCIPTGNTTIPVTVYPNGGDGGLYQVSVNGGASFATAGTYTFNLNVNSTYTIVVKDASGCLSTSTSITLPAELVTIATLSNQVSCIGSSDGSISISISGGKSPFTYLWTGPGTYSSTSKDISGLVAGSYSVVVTDANNCISSTSITVTTLPDVTNPTLICPSNITTNNNNGICGAIVTYTSPIGTDNCPGAVTTFLSGLASGATFPIGSTTTTFQVTDLAGNTATCSFTVTVNDVQLPTISCPSNINATTDLNSCVANATSISLGSPITADNCGIASVTNNAPTSYPIGVTNVVWTVTDIHGNSQTCNQTVTISDNQNPAITCVVSGAQNVVTNSGVCSFTQSTNAWNASASDNCGVTSLTYTLTGASIGTGTSLNGVIFNIGTTNVLWTASDASGNTTTCSFTVVVTDNQNPVITCAVTTPQNVFTNSGICTYTHNTNVWNASATDNCGITSLTYSLTGATTGSGNTLNGQVFNIGTTTVTWLASDAAGNQVNCTFNVIVTDNQNPSLTCALTGSQNVVTNAGVCTYTQTTNGWNASATDNCGVTSLTYALTGATTGTGTDLTNVIFNLGSTIVTWTAADAQGNSVNCSFTVVVLDNQAPAITCAVTGAQNVIADANVCTFTQTSSVWDASASDFCGVTSLTYALTGATTGTGTSLAGVVFNPGTTTVTWTARDAANNSTSCSFTVTVADSEAPAISCAVSGNQNVVADAGVCSFRQTTNAWNASATDNCGVTSLTYTLTGATTGTGTTLNGVVFGIGTTNVVWTAIDAANNTSYLFIYCN